jgi:hypothetical protein
MSGRFKLYPDEVEQIARRVLRNPERPYALTYHMHNYVIEMARTWAGSISFPTDADFWVIEHPFRLPLYDHELNVEYIISGRMDQYAIWNDDRHYAAHDWKTGPNLPSRREVEEEHTQLPLYAWAAAQEYPWIETFSNTEYYCRLGVPRRVDLHISDMALIEDWLLGRCRAIREAYLRNRFEATPSERACAYCALPERCPKPEGVRLASRIRSEDDAIEHIEAWLVEDARVAKRRRAVRGFLEVHEYPTIEVGGKDYGFVRKTKKAVDRAKLRAVLEELGMEYEDLLVEDTSTEFTSKKV